MQIRLSCTNVLALGFQDFTGQGQGNQSIWLLYSNIGIYKTYDFDCNDNTSALIAPFDQGTTVKNLFYPYNELTLDASPQNLGLEDSTESNGCLASVAMSPWGYGAYVPVDKWLEPSPMITKFSPGHDYRILSNSSQSQQNTVPIELRFSQEMNCDEVQRSITINSTTTDGSNPSIDIASVACKTIFDTTAVVSQYTGPITGQIPSTWALTANLVNVSDGVHSITVSNVTSQAGNASTNVSTLKTIRAR